MREDQRRPKLARRRAVERRVRKGPCEKLAPSFACSPCSFCLQERQKSFNRRGQLCTNQSVAWHGERTARRLLLRDARGLRFAARLAARSFSLVALPPLLRVTFLRLCGRAKLQPRGKSVRRRPPNRTCLAFLPDLCRGLRTHAIDPCGSIVSSSASRKSAESSQRSAARMQATRWLEVRPSRNCALVPS